MESNMMTELGVLDTSGKEKEQRVHPKNSWNGHFGHFGHPGMSHMPNWKGIGGIGVVQVVRSR